MEQGQEGNEQNTTKVIKHNFVFREERENGQKQISKETVAELLFLKVVKLNVHKA